MAGGDSSDCRIVPTRESHIFRFRVRIPSPDDPRPIQSLQKRSTTVGGRECLAFYCPAETSTKVMLGLRFSDYPVLEAAAKVSMVLLDKTGSPVPSIGKTWVISLRRFLEAEMDDVKAICVVDNYFDVLCSVDMDWTSPASSSLEEELPDLGHDLAMMSDKQEFTDVSFDVGGESFSAHRLVLAARSPVFKAELYGPMAESRMTSIIIQDMAASTFRSMLHYLYHGSLPHASRKDVSSSVAAYQHLLIAADRYGIDICEAKLCAGSITIDSVVSMLELAEDHLCPKLKSRCFDFLADSNNFKMVEKSDEYRQLMQSFPSLSVEAPNMFKTPHEKSTTMEPAAHKKPRLC